MFIKSYNKEIGKKYGFRLLNQEETVKGTVYSFFVEKEKFSKMTFSEDERREFLVSDKFNI